MTTGPITYRQAGVDVERGDALVERIARHARRTRRPEVLAGVGGFASLCRLPEGLEDPILVSGTDGVGTKLKVAFATGRHDTIGVDLVAMCVNDVLTTGAEPLFFLDYFATGALDVDVAERVVAGIARGCEESGCALVGGETAELPGMYAPGEYDLAGFAVGVVSRPKLVTGARVRAGDVAIGLASSGLHSNGYSLARRVVDALGLGWDACPDELGGATVGDALLAPTRLYAKAVRATLAAGVDVRAMCHVTGGGLPGNLPRVLPDGLGVRLDVAPKPEGVHALLARRVDEAELRAVFNLGTGFVLVVPATDEAAASAALASAGETPRRLGEVVSVGEDAAFEARVVYP